MVCYRRGEPDRQNEFIRGRGSVCEYKKKATAQLVFEGAVPSYSSESRTSFIQGKKKVEERLWKLIIVDEEPEDITAVDDDMYKQLSAQCRKADEVARVRKRQHK